MNLSPRLRTTCFQIPVGYVLLVSAGFDLSDARSVGLKLERPDNSTEIIGTGVTVGTVDTPASGPYFPAKTYVRYTLQASDLTLSGAYIVRPIYVGPTQHGVPPEATFTVIFNSAGAYVNSSIGASTDFIGAAFYGECVTGNPPAPPCLESSIGGSSSDALTLESVQP